MTETRAPIVEIFASIQGEGRHVGLPTAFVRVAVCPIRCAYCDTPYSYKASKQFPVRIGTTTELHDNPAAAPAIAALANECADANPFGPTSFVSLTGGEPLLYPDFAAELGADLRTRGLRLALETAALDAEALGRCLAGIDHLSADYKLPNTLSSGDAVAAGEQAARCAALAVAAGISVDVKLVLTDAVSLPDVEFALERLAPLRDSIRLVLQPVTPFGAVEQRCPEALVAVCAAAAGRAGFSVMVLPQVHKMLGVD